MSATAPTTLFFPLEEGASFDFARRFLDRRIQRLITAPAALTKASSSHRSPVASPALSIRSVIGIEEELASTCRTILDLVETNGFRFDEIGVIARTLDPYQTSLQALFDRHRIPFTTTAGRPLIHEPLCKVLIQLARLPADDFYRAAVLDVVTSPLCAATQDHHRSPHFRPEQWKLIVPALRITHGLDEWKRLERAGRSALHIEGTDEESGAMLDLDIAPEVISSLWEVLSPLLEAGAALPPRGTIGQLTESFRPIVMRYLRRPAPDETAQQEPHVARLASAWDAIDRIWITLGELDVLEEEVSWIEFVELLTHALERASVPEERRHQGVAILDAMAARGLPFKALFVLGLNEKVFPRYIREDAFLRDRHRRILDNTLGFKIDEKLSGYDEEALLFTLVRQAAASRLYLSFQRADDAGRMLVPSPYLAEIASPSSLEPQLAEPIPRRLTDRVTQRPAIRMFLPPTELAQWMVMNGQEPAGLLRAIGGEVDLFRHAEETLKRIEDDHAPLAAYDGLTGPLESHWTRLLQRGIAPTPLERYARCPFQYFAADVLKLEPIRPADMQEPDALLLGTLCHGALRFYYEQSASSRTSTEPIAEPGLAHQIETAVETAAKDCESSHCTGHYLLWELAKARMVELIGAAIAEDERARENDPFIPIGFEVEAEGTVPIPAGSDAHPLKVQGRVDRLDRHRDSGALRIIDYKFKAGATMKPEDRHLLQSAVRGSRLQPPLYAGLELPDRGKPRQIQFLYLAPNWRPSIVRSTFAADAWDTEAGSLMRRTVTLLLDGMRNGRFFIVPGSYCETCPYRVACRREHAPTWWRAHRANESKMLKELRAIRVKDA